jgi:UDP-N-acetylglucosamine diphosphorylase/glucosamine-1-phosphate N-acetyltransferase
MYNNDVVAIRLKFNEDFELNYNSIKELINGLNIYQITSNEPLYEYTWDLINDNEELINIDYQQIFKDDDNFCEIEPGVVSLNPYDIWIGENAKLGQNVILDATEGPVIIDENAHIMHNSVIMGPVYIGKNAIIKIGAKIYQNTSIGPFCKIGGEVSNTIIQGYTNKQHDGFLGGSYIGEWVNIGADTNNSDLKNTYKPVKVWCYSKNKKIDTNNIFIGCFIGDHSKIGINCSINTGTIIGFGTNLYGSELIKDYIPSFSWGTANNLKTYKMTKFLETAEIVKIRRNKNLSKTEIKIIKKIQDKHFINK